MIPTSNGGEISKDQIDVRELLALLWEKKGWILGVSLAMTAFASFYAYKIASPVYESSAILLPTEAPVNNQLGAAAALLGKSQNSNADAELYQGLLTSRTVLQKLLRAPITNSSDTGQGRIEPLFATLKIDTNKLGSIEAATKSLGSAVRVDTKESGKSGIIEVTYKSHAPWLAQQIANSLLEICQEEIRRIRMARANVVMSRLMPAVHQSQMEWDSVAKQLANYKDQNRSIVLPGQMLQISRLEIEKSAKEQKYLLLRKEYELQQIEIAKSIPPMMVVDSASLPTKEAKPKRMLIVSFGFLLGAGVSVFGLLAVSISQSRLK